MNSTTLPDQAASTADRKYAVFISYRHADNKEQGRQWATWLHHTLETYEVPPDLVGCTNLRGEPVPASLYPVFRDEEELPADADLSANIQRALKHSALLVVLCSPRAVESRFVADEIRFFKELGKAGHILALMIDGEPNATDDLGKARIGIRPEHECLPEPLRYGIPREDGSIDWTQRTEPIAADVRPENKPVQGWTTAAAYREDLTRQRLAKPEIDRLGTAYEGQLNLATMKIIAGAIGLPLGEVTRRNSLYELQRASERAARLRRLAIGFAALGLLAVGAGVVAWWQRNEAEYQRNVAVQQRGIANQQRNLAEQQKTLAVDATARESEQRKLAQSKQAEAEEQRGIAVSERAKTEASNDALKQQLREASRADHASAEIRFKENRWHEAVAYLGRALRYDPDNEAARRHLWTALLYSSGQAGDSQIAAMNFEFNGVAEESPAFNGDGSMLVAIRPQYGIRSDNAVQVWRANGDAVSPPIPIKDLLTAAWKPGSDKLRLLRRQDDMQGGQWKGHRYFVRTVDVATGNQVGDDLEMPDNGASKWIIGPNQRYLARISNQYATVWDFELQREICTFTSNWMSPRVRFSANGQFLACAGSKDEGTVFDLRVGKEVGPRLKFPETDQTWITHVTNDSLLTLTYNLTNLCLHDARTGKLIKRIQLRMSRYSDAVISGDGKWVVCVVASPGHAEVYSRDKDWKMVARTPNFELPPQAKTLALSADGRYFLTCTELERDTSTRAQPVMQVWETQTGKAAAPAMLHPAGVRSAAFNPSGSVVVTAGKDNVVRLWRVGVEAGAPIVMPNAPLHWVGNGDGASAQFVAGGRNVLGYSRPNQEAKLWDAATGKLLAESAEGIPLGLCTVSRTGKWIASLWSKPVPTELYRAPGTLTAVPRPTGQPNPAVLTLWDGETARMVAPPVPLKEGVGASNVFIDDAEKLIYCADEKLRRWELPEFKELPPLSKRYGSFTLQPDGHVFIRTPWNASPIDPAEVTDAATGKVVTVLKTSNPAINFAQASFNADGTRAFTWGRADGGEDKWGRGELVQVWDTATWKPIGKPEGAFWRILAPPGSNFLAGLISPDAGGDKAIVVRIMEARSGTLVGKPLPCGMREMALSPDGRRLATTWKESAQYWFRIWDTSNGAAVTPPVTLDLNARKLSFSDDGQWLAVLSGKQLQLWSATTGEAASVLLGVDARMEEPPQGHRVDDHYFGAEYDTAVFDSGSGRLLAANDFGVALWSIAPPPGPLPTWLFSFVESTSGYTFDGAGRLAPVAAEKCIELRKQLAPTATRDGWGQLLLPSS